MSNPQRALSLSDGLFTRLGPALSGHGRFISRDGSGVATARSYIARMIDALRGVDRQDVSLIASLSYRSGITLHGGDVPAVVVRHVCTDADHLEIFTPDGSRWNCSQGDQPSVALHIPGQVLFELAQAAQSDLPRRPHDR